MKAGRILRMPLSSWADIKLKGDIELHMKASDWFAHQHQNDSAYSNVILHVVCKNDLSQDKRELLPPMLVLKQAGNEIKENTGEMFGITL